MSKYEEICLLQEQLNEKRPEYAATCQRLAEEFFEEFKAYTEWQGKIVFLVTEEGSTRWDVRPKMERIKNTKVFASTVRLEWDGAPGIVSDFRVAIGEYVEASMLGRKFPLIEDKLEQRLAIDMLYEELKTLMQAHFLSTDTIEVDKK